MTANLVNSLKKRKRRDEENDDNDSDDDCDDDDCDDDDDDDDADNNNNSNVDKYKERGKIIASLFFAPEKKLKQMTVNKLRQPLLVLSAQVKFSIRQFVEIASW